VSLVASAPLDALDVAFDVGTGTGVLAALLARRGFTRVVATDISPQAVACARDNVARLGLPQVEVVEADLYPPGRASLVVCNPPWLPGTPSSALDQAIFDTGMLQRFLAGLPGHLAPGGGGWLVLSDIAELFGLRTRAALLAMITDAGLHVVDRLDTHPRHRTRGSLAEIRAAEVVSLWRLGIPTKWTVVL
jgi:methylase of polypeptide subunit release factors